MTTEIASNSTRKGLRIAALLFLVFLVVFAFSGKVLTFLGRWLVLDEEPARADAIVVLNTGAEWYPRLIESADLYKKGFADKIVINGNRKTLALQRLEEMGYEPCCPWDEGGLRILELLGVPRKAVTAISAPDAYDTVSEAKAVGEALIAAGISSVIVTTSKFHTRRSSHIWHNTFAGRLTIHIAAAKDDPFEPTSWWKDARQIQWVLAEYGAWVYYCWKLLGKVE